MAGNDEENVTSSPIDQRSPDLKMQFLMNGSGGDLNRLPPLVREHIITNLEEARHLTLENHKIIETVIPRLIETIPDSHSPLKEQISTFYQDYKDGIKALEQSRGMPDPAQGFDWKTAATSFDIAAILQSETMQNVVTAYVPHQAAIPFIVGEFNLYTFSQNISENINGYIDDNNNDVPGISTLIKNALSPELERPAHGEISFYTQNEINDIKGYLEVRTDGKLLNIEISNPRKIENAIKAVQERYSAMQTETGLQRLGALGQFNTTIEALAELNQSIAERAREVIESGPISTNIQALDDTNALIQELQEQQLDVLNQLGAIYQEYLGDDYLIAPSIQNAIRALASEFEFELEETLTDRFFFDVVRQHEQASLSPETPKPELDNNGPGGTSFG